MHSSRGVSEDDGDLGMQGMSLAGGTSASPSPQTEGQSTFEGQRPAFGIMRLLGSVVGGSSSSATPAGAADDHDVVRARNRAVDGEEGSFSETLSAQSFHSVGDAGTVQAGGAAPSTSTDEQSPASPSGLGSSHEATELTSTGDSAAPETSARSKDKQQRSSARKAKRLTKLREEIAGPASDRPLAGSSGGPAVMPRKASMTPHSQDDTDGEENDGEEGERSEVDAGTVDQGAPESSGHEAETASGAAAGGLGAGIAAAADRLKASLLPSPAIPTNTQHDLETGDAPPGSTPLNESLASTTVNGTDVSQSATSPAEGEKEAGGPAPVASTYIPPLASPPAEGGLDEAALQRWVLSVGCVNFDLEKGPDLEFLYPSLGISREERDCIAFSSFPDTSIFDDGHAVFSWRVREVPLDSSSSEAPVIGSPEGAIQSPTKPGTPRHTLRSRRSGGMTSPLRRLAGFERFRAMHGGEDKNGDALDTIDTAPYFDEANIMAEANESPMTVDSRPSSPSSTSHGPDVSAEPGLSQGKSGPSDEAYAYVPLASQNKSSGRSASTDYIHGFCYFRQRRDATIRRGYFQKSIVILSHLPYVSFFGEVVRRLGPLFFEKGMPILEAFAQDVQSWPPPEPGACLHLPLLGSVITVELPLHSQAQTSPLTELKVSSLMSDTAKDENVRAAIRRGDGSKEDEPILASIPVTPMFEVFKEALDDMWLLWECLILAEPILVVGPDPTTCSEAVWHMLDLIKPIPFAGDFRPYFTIHDHDFKALVTKNRPSNGVIIGVTNPFMLQACKHWPHILKVGKAAVKQGMYSKTTGKKIEGTKPGGGGIAGGNSAGGGGPMHTPGLESKRKRRISKDRALLKTLSDIAEKKTGDHSANDALRLYFTDLTERFLAPLNRYVSSLIPADFSLASPSETPKIKPFNTTAFLASLKSHGTPLPVRSRNLPTGSAVRQSLYLDFIQCPNFSSWLHARIRQSREEQYMRKLAALESGDIPKYVASRGELETIDLYSRLRAEIHGINHKLLSGRRERELQPNSRWKPVLGGEEAAGSPSDEHKSLLSVVSPTLGSATANNGPPLESLVRLPANADSAKSIRNVVNAANWQRSFTSSERVLFNKKARLIDQLDRLLEALPADLRQSLLLKERQRRMDLLQKQSKSQESAQM